MSTTLPRRERCSAFGATADRLVTRFPPDIPILAADLDGAVVALEEAVERRRGGETFYVAPLFEDPRAALAQRVSGRLIERWHDIDARYQAFDALAGERLHTTQFVSAEDLVSPIDEPHRRVLRDFAMMSTALLVRSSRDVERISRVLGRRRPHVVAAPGIDARVPTMRSSSREALVVWAPDLDAGQLGVIAMAVEYLKRHVIYICGKGRLAHARGEFAGVRDAAAVLDRAACIIDASVGDPASAIALARLGVPVVAAATGGASEFLDGVLEYEPWDWRTLFGAVSAAATSTPPTLKRDPLPLEELRTTFACTLPPKLEREPLVSVIIPTYNRRTLLASALARLGRSLYKNLDVLVVNDGGDDVADIVAPYPFARLLTLECNGGPNAAIVAGHRLMKGDYYTALADDDELFPDHFSRLVAGMERFGAKVAHTNTVTRWIVVEDGEPRTLANAVRHDRTTDPLHLQVGGTMQSILYRREVYETVGSYDVTLAPADIEYHLRVNEHYDFVQVDDVTSIWCYRVDGRSFNSSEGMLEGLRAMYDRHPSQSALVQRWRESELRRFQDARAGGVLWVPALTLPGRSL